MELFAVILLAGTGDGKAALVYRDRKVEVVEL